jgi:hypothetical protein
VAEPVGDAKVQETARRTHHAMAENEWTILSEIFQAECRLSSFAINTSIVAPLANIPPANSVAAAAVYELNKSDHFGPMTFPRPSAPALRPLR